MLPPSNKLPERPMSTPEQLQVKIQFLDAAVKVPAYGSEHAACFDLVAIDHGKPHPSDPKALIFRTGLAFEVPVGWVMEIHSRSGHGFKDGVRLSNCTGVIDADYRGEVMVAVRCDGEKAVSFGPGDRIAQAKLSPVPRVTFSVVGELSETARGAGGFGSTGTKAV